MFGAHTRKHRMEQHLRLRLLLLNYADDFLYCVKDELRTFTAVVCADHDRHGIHGHPVEEAAVFQVPESIPDRVASKSQIQNTASSCELLPLVPSTPGFEEVCD